MDPVLAQELEFTSAQSTHSVGLDTTDVCKISLIHEWRSSCLRLPWHCAHSKLVVVLTKPCNLYALSWMGLYIFRKFIIWGKFPEISGNLLCMAGIHPVTQTRCVMVNHNCYGSRSNFDNTDIVYSISVLLSVTYIANVYAYYNCTQEALLPRMDRATCCQSKSC